MVDVKKDIRFRVYIAFTCICLLGLAIVVKAAMIQVKEGPELRGLSNQMHLRTDTLYAERGNIYSEDGQLLCSSIPQFDAYIDFTVINPDTFYAHLDTLSVRLSALFRDQSAQSYRQRLETGFRERRRYFPLRKNMPYYDYQVLRTFPVFEKGARRGGLIIETKTKRINPYGILAYRTIGLWRPGIWLDGKLQKNVIGLEATYDSVLNGVNGSRVLRKHTGGVWMPVPGTEVEPQNGKDIITTLDFNIQDVAEHALKSVLEQYQCKYGTCIVMEVETGKIRAMVNLGRQDDGSYWEDFNYALIPTEPGSTFKLTTILALLKDKYIRVSDMVNAEGGAIRFGNRVMKDSHLGLGVLSIKDAFAHSSNAAMAKLAYQHYYKNPEKYVAHLKALGLDKPTGIDLAGERRTRIMSPEDKDWSATTLPWMATGYGVLVSPLHTCMLYNAVANNGRMMKPYLVHAIREYGKDVKVFEPQELMQIGDSATVAQLQECVREVGLTGTAKHIRSPFYNIAGKTGTAQVADKGIQYKDGVYQGSFVGYFPAEQPRYTIAVVIRTKPRSGAYYGGTIAAPVFRMIADKVFATGLGSWEGPLDSFARNAGKEIPAGMATARNYEILLRAMQRHAEVHASQEAIAQLQMDSSRRILLQPVTAPRGQVPAVTGMGLKDAVFVLEREGMHVQIQGSGIVKAQSIPPGTPVTKGQTIVLQLS
jgi:cell division protein FtsI (penicillin-binding protein 3)